MAKTTEERLAVLEAEVAKIKSEIRGERPGVVGRTRPDFLDTFVGVFANQPDFEAVTRAIEAERDAERKAANAT